MKKGLHVKLTYTLHILYPRQWYGNDTLMTYLADGRGLWTVDQSCIAVDHGLWTVDH